MTTVPPYSQTWDLDTLAPRPDSDEFGELHEAYRADLVELADRADELPSLGDPASDMLGLWEDFLGSLEEIVSRGTELDAFIGCHAAADANNRRLQQLEAELSSFGPLRARLALAVQHGVARQLRAALRIEGRPVRAGRAYPGWGTA